MTSPAIQLAKIDTMQAIPKEILRAAFRDEINQQSLTIEAAIEEVIIKRIVSSKCAAIAGKNKIIPMNDLWAKPPTVTNPSVQSYTIYEIPAEARENRPIIDCSNTIWGSGSLYTQGLVENSDVTLDTYAEAMLVSRTHTDTSPPMALRVSNSSIRIASFNSIGSNFSVDCLLGYDETFLHIPRASYSEFSEVVKCCTKIYVYNELVIKINSGEVLYGSELGTFKDIISEYRDEKDKLATLLDQFKTQTDMDQEKMLRFALICL